MEIAVSDDKIEFSSNPTCLTSDSTWLEMNEPFVDRVSMKFEGPAVWEIGFTMTKGLQLFGTFALEGRTLMEFLGKKSAKDFGLPKYCEPHHTDGSLPAKRSLALKALGREGLM